MQLLLSITLSLLTNLQQLGSTPTIVEQEGAYTRYELTDQTSLEVYESDTITVVFTACSPQCSSCARIYNKEGKELGTIPPPFTSIFPLAEMDKKSGRISWTDNDTWNYQSTL